jgi:hypothetical protein
VAIPTLSQVILMGFAEQLARRVTNDPDFRILIVHIVVHFVVAAALGALSVIMRSLLPHPVDGCAGLGGVRLAECASLQTIHLVPIVAAAVVMSVAGVVAIYTCILRAIERIRA